MISHEWRFVILIAFCWVVFVQLLLMWQRRSWLVEDLLTPFGLVEEFSFGLLIAMLYMFGHSTFREPLLSCTLVVLALCFTARLADVTSKSSTEVQENERDLTNRR